MFSLIDFSKKDKTTSIQKPKLIKYKKPRKEINLGNIANAAATGSSLGAAGGILAGGSKKATIIGTGSGLILGSGASLINQITKKTQKS